MHPPRSLADDASNGLFMPRGAQTPQPAAPPAAQQPGPAPPAAAPPHPSGGSPPGRAPPGSPPQRQEMLHITSDEGQLGRCSHFLLYLTADTWAHRSHSHTHPRRAC